MEAQSEPVRAPRQNRSRRTLASILKAAKELLVEGGTEAVTVQAVVERAGSSVGSFYARFTGKEDLLRYLDENSWADSRRGWEVSVGACDWSALDLAGTVERIVSLLLTNRQAHGGERRALSTREGGAERERAFQVGLRDSVRRLILPHWSAIRHPDAPIAVDLGLRAVMGALRDLDETSGGDQPTLWDLEPELVVRELTRLYLAYLRSTEDEAQAAGPVDFFDVWA